mmetsp:Transcript_61473/g.139170  ORF Transcript_61473/g.139170 Transcript_61473/m.139170 type:complete len:214 (-) Transcript_61473:319-960(-)
MKGSTGPTTAGVGGNPIFMRKTGALPPPRPPPQAPGTTTGAREMCGTGTTAGPTRPGRCRAAGPRTTECSLKLLRRSTAPPLLLFKIWTAPNQPLKKPCGTPPSKSFCFWRPGRRWASHLPCSSSAWGTTTRARRTSETPPGARWCGRSRVCSSPPTPSARWPASPDRGPSKAPSKPWWPPAPPPPLSFKFPLPLLSPLEPPRPPARQSASWL